MQENSLQQVVTLFTNVFKIREFENECKKNSKNSTI